MTSKKPRRHRTEAGADAPEDEQPHGLSDIRSISAYMDDLRVFIESIPSGKIPLETDTVQKKPEPVRQGKQSKARAKELNPPIGKSKSDTGFKRSAPPYY